MAKGRMLNKTISIDMELAKLSKESLLLYTWCIPHLDIKGRIFAEPEQIKGTVVPYLKWCTLKKIKECIVEISRTSLVVYYGDNFKYLEFTGFAKNQTVYEDRESKSVIPDPTQDEIMQNSCNDPAKYKEKLKIREREREGKITHLDFVTLKPSEHQKLLIKYSQENVDVYIKRLNGYIGSKGKKYSSHYFTLLNWLERDAVPQNKHQVTEEDHKKRMKGVLDG